MDYAQAASYIDKGVISTVSGAKATVIPSFSDSPVSVELVVPFFLVRCLQVGMEVVYVQWPDNTGLLLARMDGEWNHDLDDDLRVRGVTTVVDATTSSIASVNAHTHTCPDGTTSAPNG